MSYVTDLLQSVGPTYAKRKFGGYWIFIDNLMFAIVVNNILYLKTDKKNGTAFKERGLQAFTYKKQGKTCSLSCSQAPGEALENPDEMRYWGNKPFSVAVKANAKIGKEYPIWTMLYRVIKTSTSRLFEGGFI